MCLKARNLAIIQERLLFMYELAKILLQKGEADYMIGFARGSD